MDCPAGVVFHQDGESDFVAESDECSAVGKRVCALLVRQQQRLPHSDAGGNVPFWRESNGAVFFPDGVPDGFSFLCVPDSSPRETNGA